MLKSKTILFILLVFILTLAVMSPALAQDDPPDPPETEEVDDGEESDEGEEKVHPIVALFAAYYASIYVDDGSGEIPDFGAEIAAYHDDGIGFGVLANLTAIVASCEASEAAEACPTLAQLVEEFKSGIGLGQLYKMYGKPDKHGVGYLKQQSRCDDPENPGPPGLCKDRSEKSNNGKPPKDKDK